MGTFSKIKKYTKPLTEIDEKIAHLNERMTTTGMYVVKQPDNGTPATPDTPAVPPTYVDVDEGVLFEQNDSVTRGAFAASNKYIDTQFPENQRLFDKVKQAVKRSVKLTDPKTYKDVKNPQTVYKLLSVDYVNEYGTPKKKLKLQSRNEKTAARFLKKPRIKTRSELIDEKIIQLEQDMKKTGMGS